MQFCAYDAAGSPTRARTYYSVGGGFVLDQSADGGDPVKADETPLRYPFWSAADLLAHCSSTGLPIDQVMLGNETSWRPAEAVRAGLLDLWAVMQDCVVRGTRNEGVLPGTGPGPRAGLRVCQRRPLRAMDWVSLYALAVNEENAAGGRIVTAPTNGAAGIIPAVLHY